MGTRYQTVVELEEYIRTASAAGMTEEDRSKVATLLAMDAEAGVALGGGLFKIRIARRGEGKSGGYRVVYFFRDEKLPIFLLTAFAKNQQANISAKTRSAFLGMCKQIAEHYGADE